VGPRVACQSGLVTGDLDAAVQAYRAAQQRVVDVRAEERAAVAAVPEARAQLAAAIVAEARAGGRVVDLARRTGYGREQVRRILRAGGVEADP